MSIENAVSIDHLDGEQLAEVARILAPYTPRVTEVEFTPEYAVARAESAEAEGDEDEAEDWSDLACILGCIPAGVRVFWVREADLWGARARLEARRGRRVLASVPQGWTLAEDASELVVALGLWD